MNDWKQHMETHFRSWMDALDEADTVQSAGPPTTSEQEAPDLYSFFETLCALRADVTKSSRRSHETFTRFGETLEDFQRMLRELSDRLAAERRERGRLEQEARKQFLAPCAQMLERLDRLGQKLAQPPRTNLFSARKRWAAAWASFEQGFHLLREHFAMLLRDAGIVTMETVSQRFDPSRMKAVAVEPNDQLPHNTVIEELAAGYLYNDEVLKFAEVKIAINQGSQA